MATPVFGIFLVLHGLVHLLYVALSRGLVNLEPPLVGWPERSWVFANLFGDATKRMIATALFVVATLLFVVSGIGVLVGVDWWSQLLVAGAILSSATVILFWDGHMQRLPDKGFVGVIINVALLVLLFLIERGTIQL